jgi:hypothetical protein
MAVPGLLLAQACPKTPHETKPNHTADASKRWKWLSFLQNFNPGKCWVVGLA